MNWSSKYFINCFEVNDASICCIKHNISSNFFNHVIEARTLISHFALIALFFLRRASYYLRKSSTQWAKAFVNWTKKGRPFHNQCRPENLNLQMKCLLFNNCQFCILCLNWDWQPCCRKIFTFLIIETPFFFEHTTFFFRICVKVAKLICAKINYQTRLTESRQANAHFFKFSCCCHFRR